MTLWNFTFYFIIIDLFLVENFSLKFSEILFLIDL